MVVRTISHSVMWSLTSSLTHLGILSRTQQQSAPKQQPKQQPKQYISCSLFPPVYSTYHIRGNETKLPFPIHLLIAWAAIPQGKGLRVVCCARCSDSKKAWLSSTSDATLGSSITWSWLCRAQAFPSDQGVVWGVSERAERHKKHKCTEYRPLPSPSGRAAGVEHATPQEAVSGLPHLDGPSKLSLTRSGTLGSVASRDLTTESSYLKPYFGLRHVLNTTQSVMGFFGCLLPFH